MMGKILLTEASGYIGSHLKDKLKVNHEIIAISRNAQNKKNEKNVTWKSADLFDLDAITEVMKGIDTAIYLGHSMKTSAKLTQANFEDMDALLADNVGRVAKKHGVKHIIFMSGIITNDSHLSLHLKSRLECEKILRYYSVPVSTLRAGLIIDSNGSSYPIFKRMIECLLTMILPNWAYNMIAPVSMDDVIDKLAMLVERSPKENEVFNITRPKVMNYQELFERIATILDKHLFILHLPTILIRLSRYWIKEKMNGKENVKKALKEKQDEQQIITTKQSKSKSNQNKRDEVKDVRAMTRFRIPESYSIQDVTREYAEFINNITLHLVNGTINEHEFNIQLPLIRKCILKMKRDNHDSINEMIVYKIVGGDLAMVKDSSNARFEFRRILDTNEGIAALQGYEPTLPWGVYKFTQAIAHKFVMGVFKQYMNHLASYEKDKQDSVNKIFTNLAMTTGVMFGACVGTRIYNKVLAKK